MIAASAVAVCLSAAGVRVVLPVSAFTLRWQHTVERVLWEEDYVVRSGRLYPTAARIRGSGAGMEPPAGAVLRQGVWHYRPTAPPLMELVLARSEFGADYEFCAQGVCRPLSRWVPAASGPVRVSSC
ncbi:MAG: DUF1850 domain-containing protein [Sutterellaceae bacterium]|nr:DUF1850 domain-containing protein [Burkholderiaceae bacterium]MDW8429442.1 DUF1850 domain-containing protein [Sutterellaceae bacterium]